jgi:hypothetical protein
VSSHPVISAWFAEYALELREWFPGASFKRKARDWRNAAMSMRDEPFKTVLDKMVSLNVVSSPFTYKFSLGYELMVTTARKTEPHRLRSFTIF